jgi:hypothetical protein
MVMSPNDREALARVAYAEAGNQGPIGLAAVVYTVMNRVASGEFEDSVEAVIDAPDQFEPVERAGGWRNLPSLTPGRQAQFDRMLAAIQSGGLTDPTGGALYFQNRTIVAARAAAGMVSPTLVDFGGRPAIAQIGDHHFYRDDRDRAVRPSGTRVPRSSAPPGWAVVLGAYPQEFRALRAIELVKASLGLPDDIGQPKAIPLKDTKFYDAVLVGLEENRATATCLALRRSGAYCVKLAPSELNDPDASWRG